MQTIFIWSHCFTGLQILAWGSQNLSGQTNYGECTLCRHLCCKHPGCVRAWLTLQIQPVSPWSFVLCLIVWPDWWFMCTCLCVSEWMCECTHFLFYKYGCIVLRNAVIINRTLWSTQLWPLLSTNQWSYHVTNRKDPFRQCMGLCNPQSMLFSFCSKSICINLYNKIHSILCSPHP